MVIHPLMKVYGSKWSSSKTLPPPIHAVIVESFAGGAGYSLRHHEKNVVLYERHPQLHFLWKWLIETARESDIRDIPIDVPTGTDIRTLGLSEGQSTLMKWWQRTNNFSPTWLTSPWGHLPGQFTANTRARVAEEVQAIKHWNLVGCDWNDPHADLESTWFIDPPYQYNYRYGAPALDYAELGQWCRGLSGQVIVCEAACPKTGAVPDWLPFSPWKKRVTSRRSATGYSNELIWENR